MSLQELGRRAAVCSHWRWMPGMLATDGTTDYRVIADGKEYMTTAEYEGDCTVSMGGLRVAVGVPVLDDPATLGCLLALVRSAYGDPSFVARCVAGYWYEESSKRVLAARSSETEAEALVAALEAAP